MVVKPLLFAGLFILAIGAADAGKLDHGSWTPSACGEEPIAPQGLNLSSQAAFSDSVKWVKAYETSIAKYSKCMIDEANADNAAISDSVRGKQQRYQTFFEQVTEDSKRAQKMFGGNDTQAHVGVRGNRSQRPAQDQTQDQNQNQGQDATITPQ